MLFSRLNKLCCSQNLRRCNQLSLRQLSSAAFLRRSYLYVPSSSDRMLEKSRSTGSDIIIYDLEDSISPVPTDKESARTRLRSFLGREDLPDAEHIAVRVNDISTPFFQDDISQIISMPNVRSLILPKIHSAEDLDFVSDAVNATAAQCPRNAPLNIIPSIESAKGMWNLGNIARWNSKHTFSSGGKLSALLFAAEDYCADTSIIRSSTRRELLFTRSQIVIAAKAFGLDAVDMVCVNYRDLEDLRDECVDGRQLGFTGKQAIHPTQVQVIQSTFVPTQQEIVRAAKILREMQRAHAAEKGAVGLDGEMVDAPMLKQAQKTITLAAAAGLPIPHVE
ncbi:Pyruvate/Phosphoenolpyruvate kinase-like domain-containing protein [Crucibulum laeve]|uniref:Pyruvate/Phosphoenolpyruvate kinase-like domain-containing protein n=1 Tax=Crucibulum laeve TaxID=68775 RepID=A0A5C3MHP1_9AGAR|nr:Pyruvate/Phosphoenolpyruvate kinase-like domain-containing protein [Crucibulum laeve]